MWSSNDANKTNQKTFVSFVPLCEKKRDIPCIFASLREKPFRHFPRFGDRQTRENTASYLFYILLVWCVVQSEQERVWKVM